MAQLNDYQLAKEIISSLELYKTIVKTVKSVTTFRKYIVVHSGDNKKLAVIHIENNKVLVVRVK